MSLKNEAKKWFAFILTILLLADLAILLDIPFLRQVLGFLFLTILPGLLILQILKLNKIGSTEKFVLAVGLSISFLMLFGLIINNLSLSLGYDKPLATIPLLISFNNALIVLAIIGYKVNKEPVVSIPNLNLSTSEKAFLIVPILFPALSIFGMHVMNTTDNNIILMFLLFLIPIYVAFVCLFHQKFSRRLYPVVIFLISISLLLLLSLRSNHIIGADAHLEYYFFQTTLNNLHWSIVEYSTLDACLSISLLPTIYQSILNLQPEILFKILYSLIYSITPVAIYILSKKYVDESYAFLASCFFMFQFNFLWTAYNARTNIAILFFVIAIMVLFSDNIDPLKKKFLFIIFMTSCIVSHYSTTYIVFFIILGASIGTKIWTKKYAIKDTVSLTIVFLFFSMIFFWYSQVTEKAFSAGVGFIEKTLRSLNVFFIGESRAVVAQSLFGKGILQKGIPHQIEFALTWLIFALIGIGLITLIRRYREMSFTELDFKKPDFLNEKFEVLYFIIALICAGLLVIMVALPYLAIGYDIMRLYSITATILAVFFVIGGITIAKKLSLKKKGLLGQLFLGKKNFSKRSRYQKNQEGNSSQAYLIILLILIPYFLCVSGVTYNIAGVPRSILLNSEGEQYDIYYAHDEEVVSAKWLNRHALSRHASEEARIYTDTGAGAALAAGYEGKKPNVLPYFFMINKTVNEGYIYLRYVNVVKRKVYVATNIHYNLTQYNHLLNDESKIYDNTYSEVYIPQGR